jgi:hypothetical protein
MGTLRFPAALSKGITRKLNAIQKRARILMMVTGQLGSLTFDSHL